MPSLPCNLPPYARTVVEAVRQNPRFRILSLHPLYFAIADGSITENSSEHDIIMKIEVERV